MRARASGDEVRGGGNAPRTGREITDKTPDLERMNDRCERVCSNARFFFQSFQRRPTVPFKNTRDVLGRGVRCCRCQKLEIAGAPGAHSRPRAFLRREARCSRARPRAAAARATRPPADDPVGSRCSPRKRTRSSRCVPSRAQCAASPRSVKSRRAIHHRRPRTTVGPTEERSARAFATSPRGLGPRTRAVPSASATARDRLPSRRNLQPSAHHLLSSLLSFCPFGHSSANTDERRAYEPPTKRAFDRVGGF